MSTSILNPVLTKRNVNLDDGTVSHETGGRTTGPREFAILRDDNEPVIYYYISGSTTPAGPFEVRANLAMSRMTRQEADRAYRAYRERDRLQRTVQLDSDGRPLPEDPADSPVATISCPASDCLGSDGATTGPAPGYAFLTKAPVAESPPQANPAAQTKAPKAPPAPELAPAEAGDREPVDTDNGQDPDQPAARTDDPAAATPPKPEALPVLAENIPDSLKRERRWCNWCYEERANGKGEKKLTKVPIRFSPLGSPNPDCPGLLLRGPASSTDPRTWMDFETALRAYRSKDDVDGMGYFFPLDGSQTGIDFDKVRDPATGIVDAEFLEDIRKLDSYAEVSPSDTGVKAIVNGRKAGDRCKWFAPEGRAVEMYSTGRFFTITGHVLVGAPREVNERQGQLAALYQHLCQRFPPKGSAAGTGKVPEHGAGGGAGAASDDLDADDQALLERARKAANSPKFVELYDKGGLAGHGSDSEADISLVRLLAFWVGPDADRIKKLFLASVRGTRAKVHRKDYLPDTIQKVLAGMKEDDFRGAGTPKATAPGTAPRVVPPYREFPLDTLPPVFREYVTESAAALGCDPALVALPGLAALASSIGNSLSIRLKPGWTEPAVVWALTVADSSGLKSPALFKAVQHLDDREAAAAEQFKAEWPAYQDRLQEYQANLRLARKNKATPTATAPTPPVERRFVCKDITIEKLAEVLEDNGRGVLMNRDEAAGWLGSFTRYKGKAGGSDLPNWLEMFRANDINVDRKTGDRPRIHVRRANVSVTGTIQPGTLARALTSEFLESGLAARLLMAMPDPKVKQWSETVVHPDTEKRYGDLLDKLHAIPYDARKGPVALKMTPEAKAIWVDYYNSWAQEQAAVEGELAACFGKLEAYAARFALLHHVVSRVARGEEVTAPVGLASVQAGIALTRWFGYEARRIYGMLSESPAERDLRRLVEFIRRHGGRITARTLRRSNSTKYKSTADAEAALNRLVAAGLGRWVEAPAGAKGGRPTHAVELVLSGTSSEDEGEDVEEVVEGEHDKTSAPLS
jgi:hypothetical protein